VGTRGAETFATDDFRARRPPLGSRSLLAAVAERDVLVVFDGAPPAGLVAPARVEIRFARRREPDAADDEIAALVAADAAPERLRVVTSDAGLARRVRPHGAEVVGARERLDQL
jgi:predicted RNA-binding protein with PIN domain